jgi:hypothetical protein
MKKHWFTLIAVTAAVLMSATLASAQYGYGPGGPGQPIYRQPGPDLGASPRPDFPGAKQAQPSNRHSHGSKNSSTK